MNYLMEDRQPDVLLKLYEEQHHMNAGEKRALHYWLAAGHERDEAPPSRYLPQNQIPDDWEFIDIYRMDKELDADTYGMDPLRREAYIREFAIRTNQAGDELDETFGLIKPDISEKPLSKNGSKSERKLFWLWEYLASEDMTEEAEEYLKDHLDQPTFLDL